MQDQPSEDKFQDILIEEWLAQMIEDQEIAQERLQGAKQERNNAHVQGRHIREISQKLNRLQRNFLRESEVKKQQKKGSTVSHSYMELDEIYKKASAILPGLKVNNRQEGKELASQIVSLYNFSVAELSRRQKLQKELKAKNQKKRAIVEEQENLEQDISVLKRQVQKVEAQHWLKICQLKGL